MPQNARFARTTPQAVAPVVVSRQPILDRSESIVAYELLAPPSATDPRGATSSMLVQAIGDIGLTRLVGDRPAHVDVTREFLLAVRPLPLVPERVVLEVQADRPADDALLMVVREARDAGFRIALDHYRPDAEALLELAAIVKLDAAASTRRPRPRTRRGVTLIADGVETRETYQRCRRTRLRRLPGRVLRRAGRPHRHRAADLPAARAVDARPGRRHDDVRAARARDRRGPRAQPEARQAGELGVLRRPRAGRLDPPGADGARARSPSGAGRRCSCSPASATARATCSRSACCARACASWSPPATRTPRPTARSPSDSSRSSTHCSVCACRRCSRTSRSTTARSARSASTRARRAGSSAACSRTSAATSRRCARHGVSLGDIALAYREALDWSSGALVQLTA